MKKRATIGILLLCLWIFAFWKICLGLHSDEVHAIAVGDMIASGNRFFKECWFYLQTSAVYTAPIIYFYKLIFGSTEGILLLFRILSVGIQTLISVYFYVVFSKRFEREYVLAASVLLFVFVPDFQSFIYKQEMIWFVILEVIVSYQFYLNKNKKYIILLGLLISGSVLAYPTTIIQFPLYCLIIYRIIKEKQQNNGKELIQCLGLLTGVCLICATVFLMIVMRGIGLQEFFFYIQKTFSDENLDSSWIRKLILPIRKFLIIALLTCVPLGAYRKILREKLHIQINIPVVTLLLVMAFGLQCYIEREGITWHCITYVYALTIFLLPMMYVMEGKKEENRVVVLLFEWPAVMAVFAIALASNQGNITCMYGTLIAAVGMLLTLSQCENDDKMTALKQECRWIRNSLVVMALCMYIFPVWEQETVNPAEYSHRTIFSNRMLVEEGPAKGIRLGEETYECYNAICRVVQKYVNDSDNVFIVDNNYTAAYGYLQARGGYATYSPQGGWGLSESDKAVDFFDANPDKNPTVVMIRLSYIGKELDEYLKSTPIGQYLFTHQYEVVGIENGYAVMRQNEIY